jgi:hypothetical protein
MKLARNGCAEAVHDHRWTPAGVDQEVPRLHGLRFPEPPPLGTSIRLADGQDFELVKAEPYQRQTDGAASALLTWATVCPETGEVVPSVTGLAFNLSALRRFSPSLTMEQIRDAAMHRDNRWPFGELAADLLAPVLATASAAFGSARFRPLQLYELLRERRPDVLEALVPGKDNRWRLCRFAAELHKAEGCVIGGHRLSLIGSKRPWLVVTREAEGRA